MILHFVVILQDLLKKIQLFFVFFSFSVDIKMTFIYFFLYFSFQTVLCAATVGLTAVLLFVSHVDSKANFVQVNLNAKWNSTPLFLEAR